MEIPEFKEKSYEIAKNIDKNILRLFLTTLAYS